MDATRYFAPFTLAHGCTLLCLTALIALSIGFGRKQRDLRRANRRNFHSVVGAVLIVCAVVLLGFNARDSIDVWQTPLLIWLLGGVGVGLLLSAWPTDA